jgi:2-polyprenyl-3-methyl-5-hydroxy-6-metoxy-1,4-benzoquinol methylase
MQIKQISTERSQEENLEAWCFEVGSRFEHLSEGAVNLFYMFHLNFIEKYKKINKKINLKKEISDLGCGDGASVKYLLRAGFDVDAVDINEEKLTQVDERAQRFNMGMVQYLEEIPYVTNVFCHHSLEHTVDAPRVLELIGEKLLSGGLSYIAVPAGDYLHSVHHVVFEDWKEILPPNCSALFGKKRQVYLDETNMESEYVCIARKN